MTAARKPGRRPEPRTVRVELTEGAFAGWWAVARVDFKAAWLVDLQSGDVGRILAVLERVILEHNLPAEDGELAEHVADVDPYDGLMAIATDLLEAMQRLPPR